MSVQDIEDITGLTVRLKASCLAEPFRTEANLTVQVQGGFGCRRSAIGTAVFVRFSDGDEGRFARWHIKRLATDDEARAAGFLQ